MHLRAFREAFGSMDHEYPSMISSVESCARRVGRLRQLLTIHNKVTNMLTSNLEALKRRFRPQGGGALGGV